jgi:hypothetical protein
MTTIQTRGHVEAFGPPLSEATPAGIDPDEHLWRELGARGRDLSTVTLARAQEVCFSLYQANPLGHRLTELIRDFVVGDGITYTVKNPWVRDVVEEFWTDDQNSLDQRNDQFALELGLYGELLPEAFVGDVSGYVRLGYVDPGQIKRIETVQGNPLVRDVVWIREKGAGVKGRPLQVVRDRGKGVLEGDVFCWQVNSVSNATRGWPDLLHVADWLDAFDQMLWEMVERARLARTFIWDVLLKGQEQGQVDAWLAKNGTAPKGGSVRAHNEQVEWKAVAPELGSFESAQEAETIMQHIAAGSGIPKHWLSSSADTNRATAQEMGAPTIKHLARRQRYYLDCLKQMTRFVIERAVAAGVIADDEFGRVKVYNDHDRETTETEVPWKLVQLGAPEISPRESTRLGSVLTQVSNGLAVAEEHGWFGKDTSRRILASFLAQAGITFDPTQEPDVEDESDEAPARDESDNDDTPAVPAPAAA